MRKLTALILMVTALAFASNGVFAKEWKKIRIGVEGAYPPFSQVTPDGKLVGFDIDIANALCEKMGAECTMVQQDWEGIIPALESSHAIAYALRRASELGSGKRLLVNLSGRGDKDIDFVLSKIEV